MKLAMARLITSASASSFSQLLFTVLTTVLTKGFYPQTVRKIELVVLTVVKTLPTGFHMRIASI